MVLMKAITAVWNGSCSLGRLKLLGKSLPPFSFLLLLLVVTPVLPLLVFFQCRLVQSLHEPDWELMQGKMEVFGFFFPELTLTQDAYCISFIGWTLVVLPWHLGGNSAVLGVNKWRRRVQYLCLVAVSPCTGSGSYSTCSLALQTPSTAYYKNKGVSLCTKTKHGDGEYSSVSIFFPLCAF